MKLTKTLLALALSAAAGAANAQGAFVAGDLFLNVIDLSNKSSYSLDLGVTTDAFLTGLALNVTTNDANYTNFLAGVNQATDTIVYNVEGQDKLRSPILVSTFTTSLATDIQAVYANSQSGITNLTTASSKIGLIETAINSAANAADVSNYTAATVVAGYAGTYGANNSGTEGSLSNQVAVNAAINLWSVDGKTNLSTKTVVKTLLGTVDFNLGTGNVVFASAAAGTPSAVPLPTSVWMFLSGIVGLLSMKRRSGAAV